MSSVSRKSAATTRERDSEEFHTTKSLVQDLEFQVIENPFGAKPRVPRSPAPTVDKVDRAALPPTNLPTTTVGKVDRLPTSTADRSVSPDNATLDTRPPLPTAHRRVSTPASLALARDRLRSLRSYREEENRVPTPTHIPAKDNAAVGPPSSRDYEGERAESEDAPADDHQYWEDSFQRLVTRASVHNPDDVRMRRVETKVEGIDDRLTEINTRLSRLMTMLKERSRPSTPATREEAVNGVTLRQADEPRTTRHTASKNTKSEAVDKAPDRREDASDRRRTYTRFASDTRRDNSEGSDSGESDVTSQTVLSDRRPLTLEELSDSTPPTLTPLGVPPPTSATSRVPCEANVVAIRNAECVDLEKPTGVKPTGVTTNKVTPTGGMFVDTSERPAGVTEYNGDYNSPVFYYPRTSPLVNPFASIKYSGYGDRIHPMIFLHRFDETRVFERITDREALHFFGISLTNAASTWWSVGYYRRYTEARAAFKRKFWGMGAQMELHQKILLGRFEERDRTPMADYVAKFFQENQLLDNPVPEREFVVAISGHFSRDVHREIRGFAIHDVETLIEALDDYELSLRRDATRIEARGLLALPAPTASGATQRRTRARAPRNSVSRETRESRTGDYHAAETPPTVVSAVQVPRAYQPRRAARSPSPRKTQVPVTQRPTKVESAPATSTTAATTAGRRGRDRNRRQRKTPTAPSAKTPPAQSQRSRSRDKTPETRERSLSAKRRSDEQMALIAVHRYYPDHPDDDEHSDELVTYSFSADINREGRPALPLKLICGEHEWPTIAILDTGATISVISQEALMEFGDFLKTKHRGRMPRRGFVPLVRIPKIEVAGPFGHRTPLSGYKVDLDLRLTEIDGKTVRVGQTCFVANRLARPLILGTDFMRDYLAIIAFDMNTTKSSLALTFYGSAVTTVDRGPGCPLEDVVNYEKREDRPDTEHKSAPRASSAPPPSNIVREEAKTQTRESVSHPSNDVASPDAKTRKTLEDLLDRHARLLDGSLGRVDGYRHRIAMRNARPRKPKNFPVPMKYRDEVKRQLVEMERLGVVRKDATDYVNPLVVVKKNNGQIRLCLDARAINETTTDDHAQPLTIEEVLARIGDRRVYSKIDINQAYWQIELEPESRRYTGFMFEGQTYVFLRMPFGLKTAGASFTRALDLAVARVPQLRPNLTVYLDDILLASDTYEQHFEQLDLLFEALERVGVRLNKDKCEFLANRVQFLGHDLSRTTVEMTDETKRAIAAFKRPRTKKELQAFLGLVNWDRRFVPRLSDSTRTLEDMLLKNAKFHWTEERQAAFEAIKNAFREAETLFLIRNDLQYGLETDASLVGLGARLYQFDAEHPERQYNVAYASRSLKPAERNYTTTEQEGLALAWALNKFKLVLMGRTVQVKTDHRALTFLQSCAMNSRRIARWMEFFGHFDLRIRHIPGRSNAAADMLSRNPAPTLTEQPVMRERAGETSSVQEELALVEIDPYDEIDPEQWVEWLRRSQREDATLGRTVADHPDRYIRRENLVRRIQEDGTTDRIAVPAKAAWKLLDKVHRHLVHFGTDKVIDFASRYFTIDNLDRIARDVVGSCEICLATKYYTRASVGAMYYDQPTETGQMVSVDLFGPLPTSRQGHKYVLVLLDLFSKHTALFPIKNQKVETIVRAIEQHYVPRRGYPPETILTDCGGQFVTARWKQFARRVGSALRRTAPYNPQSNPVERVMRELGRVLRAYAHHDHESWDAIVPRVEDVLNRTAHASTGQTPNALERDDRWSREAPRGDDRMRPRPFPRVFQPKRLRDDRLVELDETEREDRVEQARRKLTQAARKRRTQADKREVARPYQQGDLVWRKRQRRSDALHRKSKKLFPIYEGPLIIRECPHPNAYVLEWPDGRHAGVANSRVIRPHREPKLKEPSEASEASANTTEGSDSSERSSEQTDDTPHSSDTDGDNATESDASDRESDRRDETSHISISSEEDSSERGSTRHDSLDEERTTSVSSEEPSSEEDEEESESEDLAMMDHRARTYDREPGDNEHRSDRTERLLVSHSAPNRKTRRNRRRRRNRRSRRRKAPSPPYRDEYEDQENSEEQWREEYAPRLEDYDEDDSDLYTGQYGRFEIFGEQQRRAQEREDAYQRDYDRWLRRERRRKLNGTPYEDTRRASRVGRIPTSRHDGSYRMYNNPNYDDLPDRRIDSRDYYTATYYRRAPERREAEDEHDECDARYADARVTRQQDGKIPRSSYERGYLVRRDRVEEDRRYDRRDSRDIIPAQDFREIYDRHELRAKLEKQEARPRASPYSHRAEEPTDRREQRAAPPIARSSVYTARQTTRETSGFPREPVSPPRARSRARGGTIGSVNAGTASVKHEVTASASKRKRVRSRSRSRSRSRRKPPPKKVRSLRTFSSPPTLETVEEEEEPEDSGQSDEEAKVPSSREEGLPSLPSPPRSGRIEKIASDVTGSLSMIDYLRSLYRDDSVVQENTPDSEKTGDSGERCAHIAALQPVLVKTPRARRPLRRLSRHLKLRDLVRENSVKSPTRTFRWKPSDERTPEALASLGLIRVDRGSARTDGLTPKKRNKVPSRTSSPIEVDESPPPSHQSFSDYFTTAAELAPTPTPGRVDTSPRRETPPYTLADYERDFKTRGRNIISAVEPLLNGLTSKSSRIRSFTERELGSRTSIQAANLALTYGLLVRRHPREFLPETTMEGSPRERSDTPDEETPVNASERTSTINDILAHLHFLQTDQNDACHEQARAYQSLARQATKMSNQTKDVRRVTYLLRFLAKQMVLHGVPIQEWTPEELKDPKNQPPTVGTVTSILGGIKVHIPFKISREDALTAFNTPFDNETDPVIPGRSPGRAITTDNTAPMQAEGTFTKKPSPQKEKTTAGQTPFNEEETREDDHVPVDFSTRAARSSPVTVEITDPPPEETTPATQEIDVEDNTDQPERVPQRAAETPVGESRSSSPAKERPCNEVTPVHLVKDDKQRGRRVIVIPATSPLPGTSKDADVEVIEEPTNTSPPIKTRSKRKKRVRPPRTTGSRRAEKFATHGDALARPRDPRTGKFRSTALDAKTRAAKRKRTSDSETSYDDDDIEEVHEPKTKDLSKVKSLAARKMRLRSDEVGLPVATSTPYTTRARDEPEETHRASEERPRPSVREDVPLRSALKVILRPKVYERPDYVDPDTSSEESIVEGTPPPTPTPTEEVTGAAADRDPILRAALSRATPVGGGKCAPGTPDVVTTATKSPEERRDTATNGAANDTVTVKYPGTELECVIPIERMQQFLDQELAKL